MTCESYEKDRIRKMNEATSRLHDAVFCIEHICIHLLHAHNMIAVANAVISFILYAWIFDRIFDMIVESS